jgi:hypothetical protein
VTDHQRLHAVLVHGLVVTLHCGTLCPAARVNVVLPSRYAKRYGLGNRGRVIATVRTKAVHRSTYRARLTFSSTVKRKLGRAATLRVTVTATGARQDSIALTGDN